MQLFRDRLKSHETLVGTLVTLAAPQVPEMFAQAGFDWLWIDGEHAPLSLMDIQTLVQAAGADCACLIRIADQSPRGIKQALDIGAAGIIVPLVNTAAQAREIVAQSKYPPAGQRSIGLARAQGYGMRFEAYVAQANQTTCVVLQIEHVEAVENIESIVAVDGVDAVIVGPYDLSGSLGKPGRVTDPEVQGAIEQIRSACEQAKMPLGIFAMNPEALNRYARQGYTLLALGIDTVFLGRSAAKACEQLRQQLNVTVC